MDPGSQRQGIWAAFKPQLRCPSQTPGPTSGSVAESGYWPLAQGGHGTPGAPY